MAPDPARATAADARPPLLARPFLWLILGMVLMAAAWLLPYLFSPSAEATTDGATTVSRAPVEGALPGPFMFLLLVAAAGSLLTAAVFQLRAADWQFTGRMESAAYLSVCGLGSILGYLAMGQHWVAGRTLFGAAFIACLIGTVLIILPGVARRVAISLLLLFHFGGMATAVTLVDPPGDTGPWVAKQLWSYVYRPYLSFLYLTNAYHFYSPNPGPPGLMWFAVQYDDGTYSWVKHAERANSPIGMHYQRMLALPEHSFTQASRLPLSEAELALIRRTQKENKQPESSLLQGTWQEIVARRYQHSDRKVRYPLTGKPIPYLREDEMGWMVQFREPTEHSLKILQSVARHVFWTAPEKEGAKVRSVKVYRVTAQVLSPQELAGGVHPLEKTKHLPFFLGEYDGEGRLMNPRDPMLFWYVPIVRVHPDYPNDPLSLERGVPSVLPPVPPFPTPPADSRLLDCLEMHAAGLAHKAPAAAKDAPKEEKK